MQVSQLDTFLKLHVFTYPFVIVERKPMSKKEGHGLNLMGKRKERVFVSWARRVVAGWKGGCSGAVAQSSDAGPQGWP